jgi:hypothetical protein
LVTVIWTWTGPHRVSTESPVTVLVPLLDAALEDGAAAALDDAPDGVDEAAEPESPSDTADSGPVVLTAAGVLAVVLPCVLKLSSITNPVTVLNKASTTRRMRCP